MDIRVLGPVELHAGGHPVELGPRKQRFVLAVLALEVNRLVPVDRLIELTWPLGPPRTAVHAIQVRVSRLRSVLAGILDDDNDAEISTRGSGYLLRADPSQVDASRFWSLLERAGATTDDERKVAVLTEALDLWSGPALSGVAPAMTRERLCYGLEEARLSAVEDQLDAQLRLGRHRAVLAELTELAQAHPTRERLLAQLMLALYRTGQVGDALEVYRRTRTRLAEEFGLDPGDELRRLELAILRNDASLDPRGGPAGRNGGPATDTGLAQPAPPRHLPPDVPAFAVRHQELADLDELLLLASITPSAPLISAICGTGGVGKSALAVHWAHRVAEQFPDGQLYVNLRGFDPSGSALDPAEAIRGFLDAFAVSAERIPADLAGQTGLLRSVLAGKRVLMVLDNARDVEQVRPLLPGTAGCAVIVTSRSQLTGLVAAEGAHCLTLDVLTTGEARDLLTRRLGVDRVAGEPAAVDDIVDGCAGLPLALAIVAARAATHPDFPLGVLAAELRVATGALDALRSGDPTVDVRAVFSWSYRGLNSGAARLFRLLGVHPGPDIGVAAAASLAGVPTRQVREALAELTRAHLLTEHAPGRYAFHDLLRAYAAEQAHAVDGPDTRSRAVRRVLDHYLHIAHAAARLLYPPAVMFQLGEPEPGVTPEQPTDFEQATSWFTAERPVLLAAIRLAIATGHDVDVGHLAWTLNTYLKQRGLARDNVVVQEAAVAATRRLDDRSGQARAHRALAAACISVSRYEDAHAHLRHALRLLAELDDPAGQGQAHLTISSAYCRQGRDDEALGHDGQALALFRAAGDQVGEARALNSSGWHYAQLGRYEQALDDCQQALSLLRTHGDLPGQADTLDSLGYVWHRIGDHAEAVELYQQALDLWRKTGDRFGEAQTLSRLGDAHHALGDLAGADRAWQDAFDLLNDFGHPDAQEVRTKLAAVRGHAARHRDPDLRVSDSS